jgi:hypothetical protein
MTAADEICGFSLRGFIPLFAFGQKCFRSRASEARPSPGRKSQGFVWKVFPLLDVRNVGRLVGSPNSSVEDSRTDSGLAEREVSL